MLVWRTLLIFKKKKKLCVLVSALESDWITNKHTHIEKSLIATMIRIFLLVGTAFLFWVDHPKGVTTKIGTMIKALAIQHILANT